MHVSELMTKRVKTVRRGAPAWQAWEEMQRRRVRHLVVRDRGKVVGVLSEADLGGRCGGSVRAGASVDTLMTSNVVTVAPSDDVRAAAALMRARKFGCLPVVASDRLVGILTVADLIRAFIDQLPAMARQQRLRPVRMR